jgi:hypothetical protein
MHDLLKPLQRFWISQHFCRQLLPVDLAVAGCARKGSLHGRHGSARIDRVHGGIGVIDRNALLGEQLHGGRLAHPDRSGQPDDVHAFPVVLFLVVVNP